MLTSSENLDPSVKLKVFPNLGSKDLQVFAKVKGMDAGQPKLKHHFEEKINFKIGEKHWKPHCVKCERNFFSLEAISCQKMKVEEKLSLDALMIHSGGGRFLQEEQQKALLSNIKEKQSIHPFISSTFVDLEEEIKHLHTHTFAKLKDFCKTRGCHFAPNDSRRSAIDFRSSSEFTLKHSLDNVTKSVPFFMCIIGKQYGPCRTPDSPKLPSNLDQLHSAISRTSFSLSHIEKNLVFAANHGHPWILEPQMQYCSMMELEVTAACHMIDSNIPQYCCFYFKDYCQPFLRQLGSDDNISSCGAPTIHQDMSTVLEAESVYAQNRLNQLKLDIINKGFPVKYFESKEALGQAVFEDWSQIVSSLYPCVSKRAVLGDELSAIAWSNQVFSASARRSFYEYDALSNIKSKLYAHVLPVQQRLQNYENEMELDEEIPLRGTKTGDGIFSTTDSFIGSVKPRKIVKDSCDVRIFAIVGDPGSGKTTLLSDWLEELKNNYPDLLVMSEFVGSSHLSHDATSICRMCIRSLREKHWADKKKTFGEDHVADASTLAGLVDTLACCLHLVPCVVLLDAINDIKYGIGEDIGSIKELSWLPKNLPATCRFVVSTRKSDLTYKALLERGDVEFQRMPSIDIATRERIIDMHYQQNVADVLGRDLVEKVWANRLSERPLFVSTLCDLLRSCRNSRDVIQVIDKCTALRIFRDFWKSVFVLWCRRHSWSKHSTGQPGSVRSSSNASGWVADALKVITTSRCGLRSNEILHLLYLMGYRGRATVTPSDWDMFVQAAGGALRLCRDGLINSAHEDIRLALEYCLLGSGKYSAVTSQSDHPMARCHRLLASYFLNYTTMDRKLVELPWHLDQAREREILCEVLCKPRFFLALCRASVLQSALHTDHLLYWKTLVKHDNDILHCFKLMTRSARDGNLKTAESAGLRPSLTPRDVKARMVSDGFIKPSAIIVTQHDDSAASISKSADDSRSETEEKDFSDVESFSFFLTESEAEHQLHAGGWTPSEGNAENPIDCSSLEEDDLVDLQLRIPWFLFQLGERFRNEGCQRLDELRSQLEASRPLSGAQALALFQLTHFECIHTSAVDFQHLRSALDVYSDLPLKVMELDRVEKRRLLQGKGDISLALAEALIGDGYYEEAHQLVLDSFDIMQKLGNVSGQAIAETLFGKLLTSQGLYVEAEDVIRKALQMLMKWHGKMHLSVANSLYELSQVYAAMPGDNGICGLQQALEVKLKFIAALDGKRNPGGARKNKRRAMLALKQALEVLEFNEKRSESAHVVNRIGRLLSAENSLRSKVEAQECFDRALDAVVTGKELSDSEFRVQTIHSDRKKVISDLQAGRYTYGPAKAAETRTPARPYSSLSWHHRDLERLSVCTEPYTSLSSDRLDRPPSRPKKNGSVCTSRPYSPFSTRSVGNYVLVTPRSPCLRKIKSMPVHAWKRPLSYRASESVATSHLEADHHAVKSHQAFGEPRPESHARYVHNEKPDEGKEVPVIVVPAGRNSRLSVKLDLEDWESRHHDADSVGDPQFLTEVSYHSEVRTPSRSASRFRSQPPSLRRYRSFQSKHCCQYRSGPNHLSTTVHGPHSLVTDVLPPPPAPRPSARDDGAHHRSAWFHVPGRYARPGEPLPRKRCQEPPSSETTYATVVRTVPSSAKSSPTPRTTREGQLATKVLPLVNRRQTVSQQSNRFSVEPSIDEKSVSEVRDEEVASTTVQLIA